MSIDYQEAIPKRENIKLSDLIRQLRERMEFDLQPCTAESPAENTFITEADLHPPGLALAGYTDLCTCPRTQVIGNTEVDFVNSLSPAKRSEVIDKLPIFDMPVIFPTDHNKLDQSI